MNIGMVTHSAPAGGSSMRLGSRSHTFPALNSASSVAPPDSRHVPKRYEETRVAFVQDLSHRRIMSLGFDVHNRVRQKADFEREEAIRETETRVWKEANIQKQQALDELRKQLMVQTEQYIQRLKRQHQKALQEKVLEVETALQREMLEAVEREKEEGKQRLVAAIEENDRKWEAIVVKEVKAARLEEIQKADAEKAEIRRQHSETVRALKEKAERDKATALQLLEQRKDAERIRAVTEARAEEQSLASSRAALIQEQHEAVVQELHDKITAEIAHRHNAEAALEERENEKEKLQDAFLNSRQAYVDLVHRVFGEDAEYGQIDFMQAEDATVIAILAERGIDACQVRGQAWRPHSPGPRGAAVGSVKLNPVTLPKKTKIGGDFV